MEEYTVGKYGTWADTTLALDPGRTGQSFGYPVFISYGTGTHECAAFAQEADAHFFAQAKNAEVKARQNSTDTKLARTKRTHGFKFNLKSLFNFSGAKPKFPERPLLTAADILPQLTEISVLPPVDKRSPNLSVPCLLFARDERGNIHKYDNFYRYVFDTEQWVHLLGLNEPREKTFRATHYAALIDPAAPSTKHAVKTTSKA